MDQAKKATCQLCGEPMPPGEEMFLYHGYSGNCPKPFLPRGPTREVMYPRLVAALEALYGWYDLDGSVGGAATVFEEHRQTFSETQRKDG